MPSRLSGRLALSCLFGASSLTDNPDAVLHLSHPRDCGHQGGAGPCVLADCNVLRCLHRYRGRHGVSISVSSRYLHVGGGELSFQDTALTGDPRSPVIALETGPSQPSSDAFSAGASRDKFIPRDSSLLLKVHSSLKPRRCWSWWLLSDCPWTVVSLRCVCSRSPPVFGRVFFGRGGGGRPLLLDHHVSKRCHDRSVVAPRSFRNVDSVWTLCTFCVITIGLTGSERCSFPSVMAWVF